MVDSFSLHELNAAPARREEGAAGALPLCSRDIGLVVAEREKRP